ncbi:MAG: efflux RND transporter periplasmic adaptor subunit [Clostridiaceae bacterium]|nr:efflux RND transporter periplasmic adaptor subunit [Clostridiaceae bacterium]
MKKIIIAVVILVVVVGGLIGLSMLINNNFQSVFSQGPTYSVEAVKVENGSISSSVSASGSIEEIEKYDVYMDTTLKVTKLLVEKNQKVKKGDKLFEVDTDNIVSELEKLRINKNVEELSMVTPSLEAEVKRAEASIRSAEKALKDEKEKYQNNKVLFEAKAISQSEFDMNKRAVESAEDALENAKHTYETALEARNADKKVKQERLKATNLGISDLEKQISKINNSLVCPIDGVIVEANVQEGAFTNSTVPAFRIINTEKLRVRARLSEYNMKGVKSGQNVIITGDAIDKGVEVTGKVESISPVAKNNMTSGGEEIVVEVIISIENKDSVLKPGLSVDCEISTTEKNNIVVIPQTPIRDDKDGNKYVYVIDKETNTITQKTLKLGIISDMKVEVVEGLSEGDVIVLDPQPYYKDGAKVSIKDKEEVD